MAVILLLVMLMLMLNPIIYSCLRDARIKKLIKVMQDHDAARTRKISVTSLLGHA